MTTDASSPKSILRSIARAAMVERGLEPDFKPAALAQAQALPETLPATGALLDLSHLLWCSIDNDDSRDLDQLSVAEAGPNGTTLVRVAIADVDALVARDTPIDNHASANTTSVYTPAQIFPMLPEELSTDLTSLVEGKRRLAIVVEMKVNEDGSVGASSLKRAIVQNRAKLAYNSVAPWLEGTAAAPPRVAAVPGLDENLRIQDRAAQAMRTLRHQQGSLSLESIEPVAVFTGDTLSDLRRDDKNRAKALIEDFMVAANGAAARYLADRRSPSVRRVLRAPKRWSRIVDIAREVGATLPAEPDARALDAFLSARRAADPDRFPDLSLAVVKLLGAGEYAVVAPGDSPEGHFGLAVRDYAHSTAPNRRFPDLLTQRLLKAALAGADSPYPIDQLHSLAEHCTMQENAAEKVERQVRKSAAALLLSNRTGEIFEGIVTGASDKGTWVRVMTPPVEGRVIRNDAGLDVGDRVRVQLVGSNVERGFIDFARVR